MRTWPSAHWAAHCDECKNYEFDMRQYISSKGIVTVCNKCFNEPRKSNVRRNKKLQNKRSKTVKRSFRKVRNAR